MPGFAVDGEAGDDDDDDSFKFKSSSSSSTVSSSVSENILKSILSGFFQNVAMIQPDGGSYKTLVNHQVVHIHPSSVLFGRKQPVVMFNELVHTSRKYMRGVCGIQAEWLSDVASHYYGRNSSSSS